MLSVCNTKNAKYLKIVSILKKLYEAGTINDKEYQKAKKYYLQLTGADIALAG